MRIKYAFVSLLVAAGLALAIAPAAQALTQANVTVPAQFTVNSASQFQVAISDITAVGLTGKITIEPATAGTVKALELLNGNTWATVALQAEGPGMSATITPLASNLNFRLTFSAPTKATLGFTVFDASGSRVLSSSAYPVSAVGGAQVLGSSIFVFNTNLGYGSRGVAVTELQKRMAELNLFHVSPTGYFGPLTYASVRQYQKERGIPTTGFVGPLTRASLNQ